MISGKSSLEIQDPLRPLRTDLSWVVMVLPIKPRATVSYVNSLPSGDAIWRQPTMIRIKACCLTAPSHYLNHCLLQVIGIHPIQFQRNFTRYTGKKYHSKSNFKRLLCMCQGIMRWPTKTSMRHLSVCKLICYTYKSCTCLHDGHIKVRRGLFNNTPKITIHPIPWKFS